MSILFLSLITSISVFLFFIVVSILAYEKRPINRYTDKEDWLFHGLPYKIYNLFFGDDENIDFACKKLLINTDDIERYCKILHEKPDYKYLIALRVSGVFIFIFSLFGGLFLNISLLIAGIVTCVFMFYYPFVSLKSKAMDKRATLESEIPRFLDLLQTALYLNIPIEQAIIITAKNLKGVLSSELLESIAKTQLTIDGWQVVLQELALLYDVDIFTELVLDMITSYDKGVSIADAVTRKAKDIRQTHLIHIKERATKATSTILAPVVIFKIAPMLAFLCIPMIIQIQNGF